VNVSYVLDLVNFHSVDFSGYASARLCVATLRPPRGRASLSVADFRFIEGRMGTLFANVRWNRQQEQIDIDATAIDTLTHHRPTRAQDDRDKRLCPPKRDTSTWASGPTTPGASFCRRCALASSPHRPDGSGDLRLSGDLSA
jgi:hypothetical protein